MTGLDLKVARLRAGLRQYEVAARLGVSASYLSMVETGREPLRKRLREEVMAVIAAAKGQRQTEPVMGGKDTSK